VTFDWAAGLFEGEGNFTLNSVRSKEKTYRYPRLQLVTTDEDVLRRFHDIVGCGFVYGPYKPRGIGRKPQFAWRVNGPHALTLAERLRPYLGERRTKQLDQVLTNYLNNGGETT
jgi:hypothetical protein